MIIEEAWADAGVRGVQGVDRRGEGEIWQIALASNISSRLENLLGLLHSFCHQIFHFSIFETWRDN